MCFEMEKQRMNLFLWKKIIADSRFIENNVFQVQNLQTNFVLPCYLCEIDRNEKWSTIKLLTRAYFHVQFRFLQMTFWKFS